jgi:hypothetical protein
MTTHDEQRRILELALSAPADQRGAILDRECAGDTSLRAAVEHQLLATDLPEHEREAPTLASPALVAAAGPSGQGPGNTIGPYTLPST